MMSITLWQVASIPFWASGAVAAFASLRAALANKPDYLTAMFANLITAGVCFYIAARVAGA